MCSSRVSTAWSRSFASGWERVHHIPSGRTNDLKKWFGTSESLKTRVKVLAWVLSRINIYMMVTIIGQFLPRASIMMRIHKESLVANTEHTSDTKPTGQTNYRVIYDICKTDKQNGCILKFELYFVKKKKTD